MNVKQILEEASFVAEKFPNARYAFLNEQLYGWMVDSHLSTEGTKTWYYHKLNMGFISEDLMEMKYIPIPGPGGKEIKVFIGSGKRIGARNFAELLNKLST